MASLAQEDATYFAAVFPVNSSARAVALLILRSASMMPRESTLMDRFRSEILIAVLLRRV
jgi:hypothetical protein